MMQIACYGRLGQDPRALETRTGKAMTVASIAVELPIRDSDEPHTEWIGIVAFGRLAETLARQHKGETVSVSGRAQHSSYTTSTGEIRAQLQVIADAIVSARTVRPSGRRKNSVSTTPEAHPESDAPFDDEIPF
jgi:single stranded DNA-binding protein